MASKDDLFSVADQVVLVSGGSRGIGRAIAQGFAQRGARVIITGREEKSLAATAAEISVADRPAARGLVCDVADAAAVKRLAETAIAELRDQLGDLGREIGGRILRRRFLLLFLFFAGSTLNLCPDRPR